MHMTSGGADVGSAGVAAAAKMSSSYSAESSSSASSRRVSKAAAAGIGSSAAIHSTSHEEQHSSSKTVKSMHSAAVGGFGINASAAMAAKCATLHQSLFNLSNINRLLNPNMTFEEVERNLIRFDDLESLTPQTNVNNVEKALVRYGSIVSSTVDAMKKQTASDDQLSRQLARVNDMMTSAWKVPSFGYEMGVTLCDIMSNNGGLDVLIDKIATKNEQLKFNSAKLIQQCLVTENRGYVVEKGLDKVVALAKQYTGDLKDVNQSRVGTGILEHLFKHSESTCGDVIAMGGLDTVVKECQSTDVETLRHCASALANVAMYGGSENQEAMIKRKVPSWLFPLAFHDDDTIKYYACLAIAVLVANKEIEAAVQKSGTLDLIEPFVQNHTPAEFAETSAKHSHGQSPMWLKRLIPVLMSQREEARNLAAFHFCMEAEIKRSQGKTGFFKEIGAIESLRRVASSPSGIASKYAAQTLRVIGEEVPHKLSQQVPTWSEEDVNEWVKQIGFPQFVESFAESRVDGDLLLQLTEDMLKEDIGMRNGLLRRRFMRELTNLKRVADYSSCDATNLNGFLSSLGPEYCDYTYEMIINRIDRQILMEITEDQLLAECGIKNKIHRLKIAQGIRIERGEFSSVDENVNLDKSLDVFISYRRSNGSQLASLLKVHLEIRNFSVFLDVDRLEAGPFDNNLLSNIRAAHNFVLVLTPGALDRCFNDHEQRDWIHKEVACALSSKCKIIPVFDDFLMPESESLPETMRQVTTYNGVKWIHDYQEACVEKIGKFIRGDTGGNPMMERFLNSQPAPSSYSGYARQTSTYNRTLSQDSQRLDGTSSGSDNEAGLSFSSAPKD